MLPPYIGARASVPGTKKYDWLQESSHFADSSLQSLQDSQAASLGQTAVRVENTRKILAETDKFITCDAPHFWRPPSVRRPSLTLSRRPQERAARAGLQRRAAPAPRRHLDASFARRTRGSLAAARSERRTA